MNRRGLKFFSQLLAPYCFLLIPGLVMAVEEGDTAPSFTLTNLSGEPVSLSDYHGDVVYLDFWASWCGPCRLSFPVMERLQASYSEQGFTVLAINVDQRRADADNFLAERGVSFPVLFDEAGSTPEAFSIKGMPTSFLIDANGQVIYVHPGFKKSDGARIEALVKEALLQ